MCPDADWPAGVFFIPLGPVGGKSTPRWTLFRSHVSPALVTWNLIHTSIRSHERVCLWSMSLSYQSKGIIILVLRMFLFWVNGSHSVEETWSSFGWRWGESRADILKMIGQSVFCCKGHWASQELSKQEAPSWGITQPVCTHARDRVGKRDGGLCVCVCLPVCVHMDMCEAWGRNILSIILFCNNNGY